MKQSLSGSTSLFEGWKCGVLCMLNVHLLLGLSAVPAVVVIPCQEAKNRLEVIDYRFLFDFSDSN